MEKYSFWVTSLLGAIAFVFLIMNWSSTSTLQKLPVMYLIALALHEVEELKFPGGFVELTASMTGLKVKNLGMAKFGLLIFTLFVTVVPAFISEWIWPVMAVLFIGIIEVVGHCAAARINKARFYSPGLITAIFIQFPVTAFGYYYLYSHGLVKGIYWLWAILFILIPLVVIQRMIVTANGMSYKGYWSNASKSLLSKKDNE